MQLKQNLEKYIFWILFTSVNLVSLLFKLGKLDIVEYKYDQNFAFSVVQNCNNGNFFNYIESSAGIPAGPLIYFYECIGGIVGISSYINLLVFEILISHFLIVCLFFFLRNYLNPYSNLLTFTFLLLNPYLIVIGKNPGITAHYEIFAFLFIYFFLKRNDKTKNYFYLGFISSLSFAAYVPIFIIFFAILLTLLVFKKIKHLGTLIFGSLLGFILALSTFVPYYIENPIEFMSSRSRSWGLSSFWRILLDLLSGKSIKAKVNHVEDYALLTNSYPFFDNLIQVNYYLLLFIFIFSLCVLLRNYKFKQINDFEILFIGSFFTTGVIFTIFDVPLYAHYLLVLSIYIYIFIFMVLKNKFVVMIIFSVIVFSNIYLNYSFYNFIEQNNGAHRSDYGKAYNVCGCCVVDITICKGQ